MCYIGYMLDKICEYQYCDVVYIYIYMRIDASSGCSSCRRRQGNPWDLMMNSRSRGRITSKSVERQCEYYVYNIYIHTDRLYKIHL